MNAPLPQPAPIDRTGWERGRWDDEADSHQWVTKAGLRAAWIRDPHMGFLCGYVEATEALSGEPYERLGFEVHGGLTFSGPLAGQTWWLGFDCAHGSDIKPSGLFHSLFADATRGAKYRTAAFVEAECERLALQMVGR